MRSHEGSRFRTVIIIAGAIVVLCLISFWLSSARGQVGIRQCDLYNTMRSGLKARYDEHPAGGGTVRERSAIELLTSPNGKTWTILVVKMSGEACILATGENWTFHMLKIPGKDS